MAYCPLKYLCEMYPLSVRSKTRRRVTFLLLIWICSCQSVGKVNFAFSFTTSVTIAISIFQIFRYEQRYCTVDRLWRFYLTTHPIRKYVVFLWMFFFLRRVRHNKLFGQGYANKRLKSWSNEVLWPMCEKEELNSSMLEIL